jgi:hypothetical protein
MQSCDMYLQKTRSEIAAISNVIPRSRSWDGSPRAFTSPAGRLHSLLRRNSNQSAEPENEGSDETETETKKQRQTKQRHLCANDRVCTLNQTPDVRTFPVNPCDRRLLDPTSIRSLRRDFPSPNSAWKTSEDAAHHKKTVNNRFKPLRGDPAL